MKAKIFLFFICLSFYKLHSQFDSLKYKNAFKVDLFFPVYALATKEIDFSISYERYIEKKHGIQVSFFYYDSKQQINYNRNSKQLIFDYKRFINKKRKINYFVGSYLEFIQNQSFETNVLYLPQQTYNIKDLRIAYGILNGVQFFNKSRFTADFIFGIGYSNSIQRTIQINNDIKSEKYNYPSLRLALNIGYLF